MVSVLANYKKYISDLERSYAITILVKTYCEIGFIYVCSN